MVGMIQDMTGMIISSGLDCCGNRTRLFHFLFFLTSHSRLSRTSTSTCCSRCLASESKSDVRIWGSMIDFSINSLELNRLLVLPREKERARDRRRRTDRQTDRKSVREGEWAQRASARERDLTSRLSHYLQEVIGHWTSSARKHCRTSWFTTPLSWFHFCFW